MSTAAIVPRAFDVFRADAVDGYDQPMPFDPAQDEPTDAYLEGFAFWGLAYLDARS